MSPGGPRTSPADSLALRFSDLVRDDGVLQPQDGVLVGLSGGLDSAVLLHLLRFSPDLPPLRILAAHFDHGMRPESSGDAAWVGGLCRAWEVPLRSAVAKESLRSEEEARQARFGFLLQVKQEEGLPWILLGHHGDDQAETVLFRIGRGTGLLGLTGIPRSRPPGIYRPLLQIPRSELERYARAMRVPFRQDSTNLDLSRPRNLLRHRILPDLERGVAPGVRTSLRRLARLAAENEEAWDSLLPTLLSGVMKEDGDGGPTLARPALLSYHPALRKRLLREVLRRSGVQLGEAGTKALVEFTRTGASGSSMSLPKGARIIREFDRFRIEFHSRVRPEEAGALRAGEGRLILEGPSPGLGEVVLGGNRFRAAWGPEPPTGSQHELRADPGSLAFPLILRGWEPGDRIRLSYGTKKLKKLLAEARVPVADRERVPVLADADGRVIWVAGVALSAQMEAPKGSRAFTIGIRNVTER